MMRLDLYDLPVPYWFEEWLIWGVIVYTVHWQLSYFYAYIVCTIYCILTIKLLIIKEELETSISSCALEMVQATQNFASPLNYDVKAFWGVKTWDLCCSQLGTSACESSPWRIWLSLHSLQLWVPANLYHSLQNCHCLMLKRLLNQEGCA